MNLKIVNKQKVADKKENINRVMKILNEHPNYTNGEIKEALKSLGVSASISSIKRYKTQINESKPKTPKSKTPKRTKEQYPYTVQCPKCKTKSQITSNPIQSVMCGRCGMAYDRENKKWVSLRKRQVVKNCLDFDDF